MKTLIFTSAIFLIILGIFSPTTSKANGVEVLPAVFDVEIPQGQTVVVSIDITNKEDSLLVVGQGFSTLQRNDEGKLTPQPNSSEEQPANWFKKNSQNNPTINPGETITIKSTISVPRNAPVQTHQAAILFSFRPDSESENIVGIANTIGTIVFLDVVNKEEIKTQEIITIDNFTPITPLSFLGTNKFNVILSNETKRKLTPVGTVTIMTPQGKKLGSSTLNLNKNLKAILPSEKLDLVPKWEANNKYQLLPPFGKFIAELEVRDIKSNKITKESTYFWLLPIQYILYITTITFLTVWGTLRILRK